MGAVGISPDAARHVARDLGHAGRHLWGALFFFWFVFPIGAIVGLGVATVLVIDLLRLARAPIGPRWTQRVTLTAVGAGVCSLALATGQFANRLTPDLMDPVVAMRSSLVGFALGFLVAAPCFLSAVTELEPALPRLRWSWRGCRKWFGVTLVLTVAAALSSFEKGAFTIECPWENSCSPMPATMLLVLLIAWSVSLILFLIRLQWSKDATVEALEAFVERARVLEPATHTAPERGLPGAAADPPVTSPPPAANPG